MSFFPKVEMKWTDPGLFLKARRSSRNQGETEWFVRRFSLVSGFMMVLIAFGMFWVASTFTLDPTERNTLFQRLPELPFRSTNRNGPAFPFGEAGPQFAGRKR